MFSCNLFEVILFENSSQEKKTIHPAREKIAPKEGTIPQFSSKKYIGRTRELDKIILPLCLLQDRQKKASQPRAWVRVCPAEREQSVFRCDSVC